MAVVLVDALERLDQRFGTPEISAAVSFQIAAALEASRELTGGVQSRAR